MSIYGVIVVQVLILATAGFSILPSQIRYGTMTDQVFCAFDVDTYQYRQYCIYFFLKIPSLPLIQFFLCFQNETAHE